MKRLFFWRIVNIKYCFSAIKTETWPHLNFFIIKYRQWIIIILTVRAYIIPSSNQIKGFSSKSNSFAQKRKKYLFFRRCVKSVAYFLYWLVLLIVWLIFIHFQKLPICTTKSWLEEATELKQQTHGTTKW